MGNKRRVTIGNAEEGIHTQRLLYYIVEEAKNARKAGVTEVNVMEEAVERQQWLYYFDC